MAAPGWGSRPGAGGREGAGSRARPAAARKSARGTGRWSRGSRGGGEPRAPASKTRGRKREKRRGGAGGDRGFCPRRAFRKLPGPRASPAEVPARPAPQPGGVCRGFPFPRFSFQAPAPPPPRQSWRGRGAAAGAPRGGQHRPLPLSPAEPGGSVGGGDRDSRASAYTLLSRLPVSASVGGSEPRKQGFCCRHPIYDRESRPCRE